MNRRNRTFSQRSLRFAKSTIFSDSLSRGVLVSKVLYDCLVTFSSQLEQGKNDLADHFLTALAICNTSFIIHDHPELMDRIHYEPKYEGDNADDLVLCQAASNFGVRMISRSAQNILVRYLDQTNTNMIDRDYEILCLLPFDSTRRRMSIIVRLDDQIFLFIKGAETSIWPHLSPLNDPQLKSTTEQHSLAFAKQGYRSLLVAYRQLSVTAFEDWFERYKVVANSLANREEAISDAATEIEVDLMLAGLTAVEDKLQEGVPQAIATLRCAGIKIWLLTGDKQATALSTAQAASLINRPQELSSAFSPNGQASSQVDGLQYTRRGIVDVLPTFICLFSRLHRLRQPGIWIPPLKLSSISRHTWSITAHSSSKQINNYVRLIDASHFNDDSPCRF